LHDDILIIGDDFQGLELIMKPFLQAFNAL